jgi:hypothetical protein
MENHEVTYQVRFSRSESSRRRMGGTIWTHRNMSHMAQQEWIAHSCRSLTHNTSTHRPLAWKIETAQFFRLLAVI